MTQRNHAKLIDMAIEHGARWERRRIRRAQRDALRELRDYVEATTQTESFLRRVVRELDAATRALRKAKAGIPRTSSQARIAADRQARTPTREQLDRPMDDGVVPAMTRPARDGRKGRI